MPMGRSNSLSVLNSRGFDVVRFPRPDIDPLDLIIESDGRFIRMPSLSTLWKSVRPAPVPEENPAVDMESIRTTELAGGAQAQAGFAGLLAHLGLGARGGNLQSVQLVARQ